MRGGGDAGAGGELGEGRGDDFLQGASALDEKLATQLGEGEVSFAGDRIVGQGDDLLSVGFVRDLRAADDDRDVRPNPLQLSDEVRGRRDVPDIHAQPDDFRRGF